jgi:hypothetical protein
MYYYTISFELRTDENPDITYDKFRKFFVEFLLKNDSMTIRSYYEYSISFFNIQEFELLRKLIQKDFAHLVFYEFSEIVPLKDNKFNSYYSANRKHTEYFAELVKERQRMLGLSN